MKFQKVPIKEKNTIPKLKEKNIGKACAPMDMEKELEDYDVELLCIAEKSRLNNFSYYIFLILLYTIIL